MSSLALPGSFFAHQSSHDAGLRCLCSIVRQRSLDSAVHLPTAAALCLDELRSQSRGQGQLRVWRRRDVNPATFDCWRNAPRDQGCRGHVYHTCTYIRSIGVLVQGPRWRPATKDKRTLPSIEQDMMLLHPQSLISMRVTKMLLCKAPTPAVVETKRTDNRSQTYPGISRFYHTGPKGPWFTTAKSSPKENGQVANMVLALAPKTGPTSAPPAMAPSPRQPPQVRVRLLVSLIWSGIVSYCSETITNILAPYSYTAIVSYTSNRPQQNIGNCFGLYIPQCPIPDSGIADPMPLDGGRVA